jgi:hypothetical protein
MKMSSLIERISLFCAAVLVATVSVSAAVCARIGSVAAFV